MTYRPLQDIYQHFTYHFVNVTKSDKISENRCHNKTFKLSIKVEQHPADAQSNS